MLSKEQIDRLDELAESVKGWGSCNQSWLFDDDDGYQTFAVGHVSYDGAKFQAATVDCANYDSNDGENLAAFYADANPQAISELIAMLREAQKDTARIDAFERFCCAYGFQDIHEGNRWTIEGPFATFRKAIDESMAYDAAMQRDCDGAQHAEVAE